MKSLVATLIIVCFLSGCGPWIGGGGSYFYERYDPATNATMTVAVESNREVGPSKIHFFPDGEVDITTEGIQPGPDNLSQALGIISDVVKAGTLVAIP